MSTKAILAILVILITIDQSQSVAVMVKNLKTENPPSGINLMIAKLFEAASYRIAEFTRLEMARKFKKCDTVFANESLKWLKNVCERKTLSDFQYDQLKIY